MKITSANRLGQYINTGENMKQNTTQSYSKKIVKKFDEIIIHSNTPASEDKFIQDVASRVSMEVKSPTPRYKLDDIKNQIEEGTYQIGLDEVVKKIMLA